MASMLCIAAFAADAPAADVVLRVSALKKDGTTVLIADYKSFISIDHIIFTVLLNETWNNFLNAFNHI